MQAVLFIVSKGSWLLLSVFHFKILKQKISMDKKTTFTLEEQAEGLSRGTFVGGGY